MEEQVPDQDKKKKKKLGSKSRGVSDMFRTLYRTHLDLSSMADSKSNIMISINGIIISIILASISPKIDSNPWLLIPTSILLLASAASMVFAVLSARPRVSSEMVTLDDVRENRANILFFGNYHTLPREEYVEGLEELMRDSTRLYDNMARDVYGIGIVLAKKYKLLRVSYNIFMMGLIVSVLCFIAVFALITI